MPSKMWIASKSVSSTGYQHLYLVYDPDGDPNTGDELVFRGGPENNNLSNLGVIEIENWKPISQSEDRLIPGEDPYTDRNYTTLNTNGKTPEQIKQEMSDWASDTQTGTNPNTQNPTTDIPYTVPLTPSGQYKPPLNSNTVIRSGLDHSGIDINSNTPRNQGGGTRKNLSEFPGYENSFTSSDGHVKLNQNGDSINIGAGGSNTYIYDANTLNKGTAYIVEDRSLGTPDSLVINGIPQDQIEFRRTLSGDLEIYFPWNVEGEPGVVIKDQWKHGIPAMDSIWIGPPGMPGSVLIPLGDPAHFPVPTPWGDIPPWLAGALAPIFGTPGAFNLGGAWGGDPLVLDLNGDGQIELTSIDNGVRYDVWNDGYTEATGWVGANDGILVYDADNDGLIEGYSELFASPKPLSYFVTDGVALAAENGFAQLSAFDTNHDGVLNAQDAGYAQVKVWQDINQNGVSDAGELKTLTQLNIASINIAGAGNSFKLRLSERYSSI